MELHLKQLLTMANESTNNTLMCLMCTIFLIFILLFRKYSRLMIVVHTDLYITIETMYLELKNQSLDYQYSRN